MPKSRKLEAQLAAMRALRAAPVSAETVAELRRGLAHRNSHAVAMAAAMVAEFELLELEADLAKAFARFMRNAAKTDPGCRAKAAVVGALAHLESHDEAVFLQGIRHVQMEPVWGGEVDTAAPLRGACAMALVQMRSGRAMVELAHLLADPESDARIAAARALAYAGDPASMPLLRFKVLTGDAHPQVLSECFGALLKLDPGTSLPFVAGYLEHEDDALVEAAALAMGESRQEDALPVLSTKWEQTFDADVRRTLLLAIAMLRFESAIDLLLEIVRYEARPHVEAALEALQMYRRDETVWAKVEKALAGREGG